MPLQLYDKEKILDACLDVFARHGYQKTSTMMLAEAAGISKALIFHHFKSKKELYLSVLDHCIEKGKMEVNPDTLLEYQDFFEAKEKVSIIKFGYFKRHSNAYKVWMEALYDTPDELKADIEEKYGGLISQKDKMWERLFEKVALKEGVDRKQAFRLIMIILDYFDKQYLSEVENNRDLDETYFEKFLNERNSFLSMIRYGIQK